MADPAVHLQGVDTSPSAARMYDYYLGGTHWFEVDRQAAENVLALWPLTLQICRSNRSFLHRAVRVVATEGVDQFLDIGSGIPTMGNVHEIAQEVNGNARTVYVDIDPVAVMHSNQILSEAKNFQATAISGDLGDAAALLGQIGEDPALRALMDMQRPICVVLACVVHFLDDATAYDAVAHVVEAIPPGSFLILTHATETSFNREAAHEIRKAYQRTTTRVHYRDRDQVMRLVGGLEPLDPGLVWTPQWRPDDSAIDDAFVAHPEKSGLYAVVARKPS